MMGERKRRIRGNGMRRFAFFATILAAFALAPADAQTARKPGAAAPADLSSQAPASPRACASIRAACSTATARSAWRRNGARAARWSCRASAAGGCAARACVGDIVFGRPCHRDSLVPFHTSQRIRAHCVVSMGAAHGGERMSKFLAGIAALTLAGAAVMPIQASATEREAGASTASIDRVQFAIPLSPLWLASPPLWLAGLLRPAPLLGPALRLLWLSVSLRLLPAGHRRSASVRSGSGRSDARAISTRARRRTCRRWRLRPPSRARPGGCGPCSPAGLRSCGSTSRRSARPA